MDAKFLIAFRCKPEYIFACWVLPRILVEVDSET